MRGRLGILFFITLLFLIVFISAENNSNNTVELQHVYDNLKCRVDFYYGVTNSMSDIRSSNSLNQTTLRLQSDLAQVQTYAEAGNRDALGKYVKDNFESDHSTIKDSISSWRESNVRNLTREQKASLLSQFNQLKKDYDTCQLNSLIGMANGRINYFQNVIETYQKKIDALSAKGIDVSSLNQLISDAQAQIIDPLQTAINSSNNLASINQDLKMYCLFDGCPNGINFHLAAKFEVAKLQIGLDKISNANVSQTSIAQLQTDITTANSILTQVGTAKYTSSQNTQLFNAIKDGYNVLRAVSTENKSHEGNNTK